MMLVTICLITIFFQFCTAQYGYIRVGNIENTTSLSVCATYNNKFKTIPLNQNFPYKFQDLYPSYGCANSSASVDFRNQFVMIQRGNCTFAEKALNFQRNNASGVMVVSNTSLVLPSATNEEYNKVNVFVMLISEESYKKIASFSANLTTPVVWLYGEENLPYDFSIAVLLMLAVIVLSMGSWWHKKSFESETKKKQSNKKTEEFDIQVKHTLFYVILSSLIIVLMYNFYYYLVTITQIFFVIGSGFSFFNVLKGVVYKLISISGHQPRLTISKNHVSPLSVLLLLASYTVSVSWFVYRHSWFNWILMDILGASFCMYVIKSVGLPNLTVSSSLMSFFFFYDVFYVFITPYITPSGQSVMVSVATGGGSGSNEGLPGLFELPKFHVPECNQLSNSMLGFGDVLLPAFDILPRLHVALCAVWDTKATIFNKKPTNVYYTISVISYMFGLLLTTIALTLMETGQPALLYIVPSLLLTTYAVAIRRGEVKEMMRGSFDCDVTKGGEKDALLEPLTS